MGLKVIIFLGPPRKRSVQRQVVRYEFNGYVSKPTRLLGVALFRLLCAERGIPEEVIIFGHPDSDWDMLHELAAVPYTMPLFQQLDLRAQIDAGGVSQGALGGLEHFLSSFLGGVRVRCRIMAQTLRGSMQAPFFHELAEHLKPGDELHVDLAQDLTACGLFASAASAFLEHGSRVSLGGLYMADMYDNSVAGTHVLVIDRTDELLDWVGAITLFRQSGLIGRLPELLHAIDPKLARSLRRINFAVVARRYEVLHDAARVMFERFDALLESHPQTVGHFFARRLFQQDGEWLRRAHLADWELEFARRALFSGDFARAATLTQSAVVSAAIASSQRRVQAEYRQRVLHFLMDPRHHEELFPVDPWPFLKLDRVRQVLTGHTAWGPDVEDVLRNEDTLQQFLERAISFASVLVARFKRLAPA